LSTQPLGYYGLRPITYVKKGDQGPIYKPSPPPLPKIKSFWDMDNFGGGTA